MVAVQIQNILESSGCLQISIRSPFLFQQKDHHHLHRGKSIEHTQTASCLHLIPWFPGRAVGSRFQLGRAFIFCTSSRVQPRGSASLATARRQWQKRQDRSQVFQKFRSWKVPYPIESCRIIQNHHLFGWICLEMSGELVWDTMGCFWVHSLAPEKQPIHATRISGMWWPFQNFSCSNLAVKMPISKPNPQTT